MSSSYINGKSFCPKQGSNGGSNGGGKKGNKKSNKRSNKKTCTSLHTGGSTVYTQPSGSNNSVYIKRKENVDYYSMIDVKSKSGINDRKSNISRVCLINDSNVCKMRFIKRGKRKVSLQLTKNSSIPVQSKVSSTSSYLLQRDNNLVITSSNDSTGVLKRACTVDDRIMIHNNGQNINISKAKNMSNVKKKKNMKLLINGKKERKMLDEGTNITIKGGDNKSTVEEREKGTSGRSAERGDVYSETFNKTNSAEKEDYDKNENNAWMHYRSNIEYVNDVDTKSDFPSCNFHNGESSTGRVKNCKCNSSHLSEILIHHYHIRDEDMQGKHKDKEVLLEEQTVLHQQNYHVEGNSNNPRCDDNHDMHEDILNQKKGGNNSSTNDYITYKRYVLRSESSSSSVTNEEHVLKELTEEGLTEDIAEGRDSPNRSPLMSGEFLEDAFDESVWGKEGVSEQCSNTSELLCELEEGGALLRISESFGLKCLPHIPEDASLISNNDILYSVNCKGVHLSYSDLNYDGCGNMYPQKDDKLNRSLPFENNFTHSVLNFMESENCGEEYIEKVISVESKSGKEKNEHLSNHSNEACGNDQTCESVHNIVVEGKCHSNILRKRKEIINNSRLSMSENCLEEVLRNEDPLYHSDFVLYHDDINTSSQFCNHKREIKRDIDKSYKDVSPCQTKDFFSNNSMKNNISDMYVMHIDDFEGVKKYCAKQHVGDDLHNVSNISNTPVEGEDSLSYNEEDKRRDGKRKTNQMYAMIFSPPDYTSARMERTSNCELVGSCEKENKIKEGENHNQDIYSSHSSKNFNVELLYSSSSIKSNSIAEYKEMETLTYENFPLMDKDAISTNGYDDEEVNKHPLFSTDGDDVNPVFSYREDEKVHQHWSYKLMPIILRKKWLDDLCKNKVKKGPQHSKEEREKEKRKRGKRGKRGKGGKTRRGRWTTLENIKKEQVPLPNDPWEEEERGIDNTKEKAIPDFGGGTRSSEQKLSSSGTSPAISPNEISQNNRRKIIKSKILNGLKKLMGRHISSGSGCSSSSGSGAYMGDKGEDVKFGAIQGNECGNGEAFVITQLESNCSGLDEMEEFKQVSNHLCNEVESEENKNKRRNILCDLHPFEDIKKEMSSNMNDRRSVEKSDGRQFLSERRITHCRSKSVEHAHTKDYMSEWKENIISSDNEHRKGYSYMDNKRSEYQRNDTITTDMSDMIKEIKMTHEKFNYTQSCYTSNDSLNFCENLHDNNVLPPEGRTNIGGNIEENGTMTSDVEKKKKKKKKFSEIKQDNTLLKSNTKNFSYLCFTTSNEEGEKDVMCEAIMSERKNEDMSSGDTLEAIMDEAVDTRDAEEESCPEKGKYREGDILAHLREEISLLERDNDRLRGEKELFKEKCDNLKNLVDGLSRESSISKRDADNWQNINSILKSENDSLQSEITLLRGNYDSVRSELRTMQNENGKLREDMEKATEEGRSAEEELRTVREENEKMKREYELLLTNRENMKTEKMNSILRINHLEEQVKKERHHLRDLERELESKTSELENKTRELDDKTSELDDKTSELEGKTRELEGKTRELDDKTRALDDKTRELDDRMRELLLREEEVKSLRSALDDMKREKQTLEEKLTKCKEKNKQVTQLSEEKITEIEEMRKVMKSKDEKISEMKTNEDILKGDIKEYLMNEDKNKNALKRLTEEVKVLECEIEKMKKCGREMGNQVTSLTIGEEKEIVHDEEERKVEWKESQKCYEKLKEANKKLRDKLNRIVQLVLGEREEKEKSIFKKIMNRTDEIGKNVDIISKEISTCKAKYNQDDEAADWFNMLVRLNSMSVDVVFVNEKLSMVEGVVREAISEVVTETIIQGSTNLDTPSRRKCTGEVDGSGDNLFNSMERFVTFFEVCFCGDFFLIVCYLCRGINEIHAKVRQKEMQNLGENISKMLRAVNDIINFYSEDDGNTSFLDSFVHLFEVTKGYLHKMEEIITRYEGEHKLVKIIYEIYNVKKSVRLVLKTFFSFYSINLGYPARQMDFFFPCEPSLALPVVRKLSPNSEGLSVSCNANSKVTHLGVPLREHGKNLIDGKGTTELHNLAFEIVQFDYNSHVIPSLIWNYADELSILKRREEEENNGNVGDNLSTCIIHSLIERMKLSNLIVDCDQFLSYIEEETLKRELRQNIFLKKNTTININMLHKHICIMCNFNIGIDYEYYHKEFLLLLNSIMFTPSMNTSGDKYSSNSLTQKPFYFLKSSDSTYSSNDLPSKGKVYPSNFTKSGNIGTSKFTKLIRKHRFKRDHIYDSIYYDNWNYPLLDVDNKFMSILFSMWQKMEIRFFEKLRNCNVTGAIWKRKTSKYDHSKETPVKRSTGWKRDTKNTPLEGEKSHVWKYRPLNGNSLGDGVAGTQNLAREGLPSGKHLRGGKEPCQQDYSVETLLQRMVYDTFNCSNEDDEIGISDFLSLFKTLNMNLSTSIMYSTWCIITGNKDVRAAVKEKISISRFIKKAYTTNPALIFFEFCKAKVKLREARKNVKLLQGYNKQMLLLVGAR
ncbi:conserved Plasmodium protein, unknown function [Plasmodium ovale]|uniref:Uncharacterized protein n=2 Tax=Plasmodium ovale TaxID=36330 RepID=A0A1A8X6V6_PLAOA|nr:conserved Plasmodium protein, unknown function [Plasmodium ovale curtisi]SBS99957.1 conserved Plasmodium protein, unknown function [Plasmodium ovale curtisi]SCP05506.1 conserved Plasmodium protein, unknown function [Plasmodium ovale]